MATTIINPAPNNNTSDNSWVGYLVGGIILIVFLVLFFVYGLPLLRGLTTGGVQVNLPETVNVDVQPIK